MTAVIKPPHKTLFRAATVADARDIFQLEHHATGANRGSLSNLIDFLTSDSGHCGLCFYRGIFGSPLVGYFLYDAFDPRSLIVCRDLLIHPHHRRQGIALSFLTSLSLFCQEYSQNALFRVHEENLPAHLLLHKAGWPCDRILHNFFGPNQHAYRFRNPNP